MANRFDDANKKIQNLMTLYNQLDNLPNRGQWRFEPRYDIRDTCAFVFSHPSGDGAKRYDSLNELAGVLYKAGIKNAIQARDGVMADIVIAPEYAELARKMFARYQTNGNNISLSNTVLLEQEWLRQCQK